MAYAKVIVPPVQNQIQLTLTEDEAATLRRVAWLISGSPKHSRRAHTDAIGRALADAGVPLIDDDGHGEIHF